MTSTCSTGAGHAMTAVVSIVVLALLSTRMASTQGSLRGRAATHRAQTTGNCAGRSRQRAREDARRRGGTPDAAALAGQSRSSKARCAAFRATRQSRQGAGRAPRRSFAPFIVVDHAGKELARITEGGEPSSNGLSLSRGLYVLDGRGQVASHLGAMADGGGRIYAARNGATPVAAMAATETGGRIPDWGTWNDCRGAVSRGDGRSGAGFSRQGW